MNPNDNQQIGQVIKLNDGYVLTIYGQTVACRDEKELGARVARLAKRGRKAGSEVKTPLPEPAPLYPEVVPAPAAAFLGMDQREQTQLGNLYRLIQARLLGEMTEEELMDATVFACPDLDRERVVATIQQYTEQYFGMRPPAPGEDPLGPKCSCAECPMNQSQPNALQQCVLCFRGEHLHPMPGQERPAPGPKVVQAPESWWSEEDDDESPDAERDDPTDVPEPDDKSAGSPADVESVPNPVA